MSKERKLLYTYVEVDDNTPIQKLDIKDQLRVLLKRLTYDDAQELQGDDAVTLEELTMKANLLSFIKGATEPIKQGKKKSVTMQISNIFESYLNEELVSNRIKNYYNVTVMKPDIEYDVPFFISVRLEVKEN